MGLEVEGRDRFWESGMFEESGLFEDEEEIIMLRTSILERED